MSQSASQSAATGGSVGADAPGTSWVMIALIAGAVVIAGLFLFRKGKK